MPLQMTADVLERVQRLSGSGHWTWLYDVVLDENADTALRYRFRLTPWGAELVLPSPNRTFYPANVQHKPLRFDGAGNLPTVEVSIGNQARTVGRYVEFGQGGRGKPLTIYGINVELLATAGAIMQWTGVIRSVTMSDGLEKAPTVTLSAEGVNLTQVRIPMATYSATRCRAIFGLRGGRCGFRVDAQTPSDLRRCARTHKACSDHGDYDVTQGRPRRHPDRWGGYVGVLTQRSAT